MWGKCWANDRVLDDRCRPTLKKKFNGTPAPSALRPPWTSRPASLIIVPAPHTGEETERLVLLRLLPPPARPKETQQTCIHTHAQPPAHAPAAISRAGGLSSSRSSDRQRQLQLATSNSHTSLSGPRSPAPPNTTTPLCSYAPATCECRPGGLAGRCCCRAGRGGGDCCGCCPGCGDGCCCCCCCCCCCAGCDGGDSCTSVSSHLAVSRHCGGRGCHMPECAGQHIQRDAPVAGQHAAAQTQLGTW